MAKCASNGDDVEEWVGGSAWEEERFVAGGSAIVIVLVRRMCGSVVRRYVLRKIPWFNSCLLRGVFATAGKKGHSRKY